MVRPKKAPARKQPRGAIDFKKIKRKIGRKLPPPRNATSTEIKSKTILLPEQTLAADRSGLALSSKGLTLRELLQQSSHHNPRFRRSALLGIRDLLLHHPPQLHLHRLAIVEKLRERVCDADDSIRDAFYQLLRNVILASPAALAPADPSVSLIMAYVLNAMTHLALDVRLTAFKFLDLVVSSCPQSAFLFVEKVLDHYADLLRNRQLFVQPSGKIKTVLAGFVNFLSTLSSSGTESADSVDGAPMEKTLFAIAFGIRTETRNATSLCSRLEELVPVLVSSFRQFAPRSGERSALDDRVSFDCICSVLQCIKLASCLLLQEVKRSRLEARSEECYYARSFSALSKLWDLFPFATDDQLTERKDDRCYILNVGITEVFLQFVEEVEVGDIHMVKFLEFIEGSLYGHSYEAKQPSMVQEKYLVAMLTRIPMLVSRVLDGWRSRILKGFTHAFVECKVDSKTNFACLASIEELLFHSQGIGEYDSLDPDILVYQSSWLKKLPWTLLQLRDANPSLSKVILRLILRIAQCCPPDSYLNPEINDLQFLLRDFCCTCVDSGSISYGPFLKLPRECQELFVCSLYYFSNLKLEFLQSLALCCMCSDMERFMALRMIDVLQSAYGVGHIHIADYISFLITVVARFELCHEQVDVDSGLRDLNLKRFQAISKAVTSALVEIGDGALVLRLLQNKILDEMSLKPFQDNMHCMLRMIAVLDPKLSHFSEKETFMLSKFVFSYLIDIAALLPIVSSIDDIPSSWRYYMKPCIFLFCGTQELLMCTMKLLISLILEDKSTLTIQSKVNVVVLTLVTTIGDKVWQNSSLSKENIKIVMKNILSILYSSEIGSNIEERHNIRIAVNFLKAEVEKLNILDDEELEFVDLT